MAKPVKRGNKWYIRVTLPNGERVGKSFPLRQQAVQWEAQQKVDAADRQLGRIKARMMEDLFDRYITEVAGKKPDGKERQALERLKQQPIAMVLTDVISGEHIDDWATKRLETVSGNTVNREWNLLSAVCTRAVKQWRWLKANPCVNAQRPPKGDARSRRPKEGEVESILEKLGWDDAHRDTHTVSQRIAAAALFAIETAMRSGEICKLEWHEVMDKYVVIPKHKAKNGHARNVPLSTKAREILSLMPQGESTFVFNLNPKSRDTLWRKAANRAGVKGLRFHDLRREALTRLATRFDVKNLAKISGHRDISILMNVYYTPDASDLADMMD